MDLYSMPQLDKTSATFADHIQYVDSQLSSRADVNKYGTVSGDILTSSAWSAVIHRPAEDSEPDELPSTVDMDAIKEPATPLPAPLTPGVAKDEADKEDEEDGEGSRESDDDDSSSTDSEADSSSETGHESNTDSEEGSHSGSCSWSDSDSESVSSDGEAEDGEVKEGMNRRSSCSSRSSHHSDSSPTPQQHFSIRETNFDQGGLKLKITKSKPPRDEESSSSTDDERDESSSDEEEKPVEVNNKNDRYSRKATKEAEIPVKNNKYDTLSSKSDKNDPLKLKEDSEIKEKRNWRKVRIDKKKCEDSTKSAAVADSSSSKEGNTSVNKNNKSVCLKSDSKFVKSPNKCKESQNSKTVENNKVNSAGVKTNNKVVSPLKGNNVTSDKAVNNVPSGTSRLRSVRKRPALETNSRSSPKVVYGSGNRGTSSGGIGSTTVGAAASTGSSDSDATDDEEEEEETDDRDAESGDEITQLAQQLSEPQGAISISEQLQVINQEDLAAILPDVVGVGGGPFDGFEDVSSGEGGRGNGGSGGTRGSNPTRGTSTQGVESSSDMELLPEQEQIVSEAIKRIHLDSDAAHEEEETVTQHASTGSSGSGDESEHEEVGYSSALLQQFVEKTEQLSKSKGINKTSQNNSKSNGGDSVKINNNNSISTIKTEAPRRKRGRPPKLVANPPPTAAAVAQSANANHQNKLSMPELEAYMRLDCSVSNVSPDSGIQSVAGSPSHQSCSPASNPPVHSPAPPSLVKSSPNPVPAPSPPPSIYPSTVVNKIHARNVDPVLYPPRKKVPTVPRQQVPVNKSKNLHDVRVPKVQATCATTGELHAGNCGKRGPGRPKGSGRRKRRQQIMKSDLLLNKEELRRTGDVLKVPPFYGTPAPPPQQKTIVNIVDNNDDIPKLPGMLVPGKRGPGRPKKTPPTLEPNLPIGEKTTVNVKGKKTVGSNQGGKGKDRGDDKMPGSLKSNDTNVTRSSGSLLHDICERVSKRLDIPLPTTRVPKPWVETGGPKNSSIAKEARKSSVEPVFRIQHKNKLQAGLDKRKKGRRKMLLHSRTLSLSRGLMRVRQHKHKKRKKKLKKRSYTPDPRFIVDVEKLIQDFNRYCRINSEELHGKANTSPSIVKKRKGSERSKTSDRDSGPEGETLNKEKTQTQHTSATPVVTPSNNVKRRPKKSTVEAPKNRERPEANNEQRLPLKKRHYHISATPAQADSEAVLKPESVSDSSKTSAKSIVISGIDKGGDKSHLFVTGSSGKSNSSNVKSVSAVVGGKVTTVSKSETKTKIDIHRNSIDEAIEACITKYSTSETQSVIVTPKKRHRLELEKRHHSSNSSAVKSLLSNKSDANCSLITVQPSKRVGSRSSSTTNQSANRSVSPVPSPPQVVTNKRISSRSTSVTNKSSDSMCVTQGSNVAVVAPRKRSGSRSSSVPASAQENTQTNSAVNVQNSQPINSVKRTTNRSTDATVTSQQNAIVLQTQTTNKRVSRASVMNSTNTSSDTNVATPVTSSVQAVLNKRNKSNNLNENQISNSQSTPPATGLLNTRSALKTSSQTPLITPLPPQTENILPKSPKSKLGVTKPPVGVFEPSPKSDEIMNIVKIPESPVKCVAAVLNKLSERLKVMEKQSEVSEKPLATVKVDESHHIRIRTKRGNDSSGEDDRKIKKRKVIRDIRVHVTKLSPSDLILKRVMNTVKSKVRRRKTINRTGFPVKKKKKKKPSEFQQASGGQNETESSPPPVLEDQTKLPLPDNVKDDVKPSLSPVQKIYEVKIKEEENNENDGDDDDDDKCGGNDDGSTIELKPKRNKKMLEVMKPNDKVQKTEVAVNGEHCDKYKLERRKASRRLIELRRRRRRCEASKRRKRKHNGVLIKNLIRSGSTSRDKSRSPSPDVPDIDTCQPELRLLPSKRLRKSKDDTLADDSDADSTKSRKKAPPRWRKKFLPAGLFSDSFKEDEPRRTNTDVGKPRMLYNPGEHRHGLLPPPYYCSKWVRQRRVNFQLPHDLWWLHTNNQLPGRDVVPSWNYKKIRTNVYYDVKPTYMYEAQACNCPLPENDGHGCGEDCINRLVYAECSPQLCPCKDRCSNQKIQKHEWAPGLDKFMTKDKGWGVKTKYSIKAGEFILEYVGEVVSEREFKNRMASRYQHDTHHYCLNLDGGLVIDGHRMGGDGRFVNHSCEPNCEMQKWSVNGLFRMALFALRDIQPHEELAYDYNFSLFNPAEGQKCKCGSTKCRGVIGGKSQRLSTNGSILPSVTTVNSDEKSSSTVGRPRKNSRKGIAGKKLSTKANKEVAKLPAVNKETSVIANMNAIASVAARLSHLTPMKPMSNQQKAFVQLHHCFLLRNLEKVKQLRERLKQAVRGGAAVSESVQQETKSSTQQMKHSEVFLSQLNALSTPRNIRTRRLAQAQENPEMTKTARLAYVFRHLYNAVASAKEDNGEMLASPFVTLPSKRKLPLYYQKISDPIDLSTLEQNIVTGVYKTVESFDQDMTRLFTNNVKFFGRTTDLGISATRLRKIYNIAKLDFVGQLEEILGESPPASFVPEQEDPGGEEEDVIRCICGLYRDEGLMIQCERCLVWQHCDCVKADTKAEHYLCERCLPRKVDLEIPLEIRPDYATEGQTHYMTLLRGDLQLRQGDTVYVLRDIPNEETGTDTMPPSKHTYKTIKNVKYTDCDIFKIERLWKDEKGERFAFGHHYLRPHETYHEPTRKFFPNELMRVPLYEVVPLDLIMGHCYVLDVNTFCKGRPVGADPQHIYICEYRVDKSARLFAKLARPKVPPVCTKSYAFEKYDSRLKITRTYTPHGPTKGTTVSRGRGGRSAHESEESTPAPSSAPQPPPATPEDEEMPLARRLQQKQRLNSILLRLLARLPSKQPLDLSYLLEPGRRHRKRPALLSP